MDICGICSKSIWEWQSFTIDEDSGKIHTRCFGIDEQEAAELEPRLQAVEKKIDDLIKKIVEK